jgi:peroxin-14
VYPLVAPPTPERLEQDKKGIEEQFEKAFGLMEQLAKDTESLKSAEQERTERLDNALAELESVMRELKSANRRREDEAQRMRDDVYSLKDSLPKALAAQTDLADTRLKAVNTELTSLKTLITQRMNTASSTPTGYMRPTVNGTGAAASTPATIAAEGTEDAATPATSEQSKPATSVTPGRPSPFSSDSIGGKASIPAWQLAMAKSAIATNNATNTSTETGASSSQSEVTASQ